LKRPFTDILSIIPAANYDAGSSWEGSLGAYSITMRSTGQMILEHYQKGIKKHKSSFGASSKKWT
jgi:hypothetical protein